MLVEVDAVTDNDGPPFSTVAKPPALTVPDATALGATSENETVSDPWANPVNVTFSARAAAAPKAQARAIAVSGTRRM